MTPEQFVKIFYTEKQDQFDNYLNKHQDYLRLKPYKPARPG